MDYGETIFEKLKNYCIIIPNIVLLEFDKLKGKFKNNTNKSFTFRKVSSKINDFLKNLIFVPSKDMSFDVLRKSTVKIFNSNYEEILHNCIYFSKVFKRKKVYLITSDRNMISMARANNIEIKSIFHV